jgi:hypothetical protein
MKQEQNQDPDTHQSEKMDPDLHPKSNPDPHERDAIRTTA